jgi:hypothetical protein
MKARKKNSDLNNSIAKHMETVEPYQDQVWSCFSFLFHWEEVGIEYHLKNNQLPPYSSSVEVLMNVPETH